MFLELPMLQRRRSSKWVEYPSDVLPAFVAEMDVSLAPPIRDALLEAIEIGDLGYAEPGGVFESFAGFAKRRFGWSPDAGRMRVVPDVMTGVVEVLRVLTAPGDGVVITPPVYPPFFVDIREAGRRIVEVPLADGELDLDGLERAFVAGAKAFLLCNPHNPTGRVLEPERLEAVATLAERHGVLVLSDEIHGPLTLPGARHTPFASLGDSRSVMFTSASKAFNTAGLKCALAIAGSDEVDAELDRLPEELQYRAGLLGVIASEVAFDQGDEWLDQVIDEVSGRHRLLATLLAEHLPSVGYREPQAGYLAWLDCRALDLGDDPAAAFLAKGRVALEPGPGFGTPGRGFARLNVGTSETLLTEAVRRMAAAVA
ncbi:MalY/PatB family protein [Pseudonocardia alaniniphila]|uniref:cysteine-S-conjugate beta-lyase n=1 Tax=Pseudonocardia alaniniphila TaxID=75291 RepID=A0ABS9TF63_9PSEU|nr:aminotransferase class I/II-fold pyridoxal phosphate-dependent enzyme [Pseudonocardia alaniniphila]MCH6166956.1 aminotransferase class I/II-fold pyridoxal phosphate-dependent enzyme [Pseudonocardia alaniniphila]